MCKIQTVIIILSIILVRIQDLCAQKIDSVLKQTNKNIRALESMHVKTNYLYKYFSDDDTTIIDAETWISKNTDNEYLGMDIRTISQHDWGLIEILHKGHQTWMIKHDIDTIVKYDLKKGQWNGFDGNFRTDWTTELVLLTGVGYDPEEDSIIMIKLADGDFKISVFCPDLDEPPITNISYHWWVDKQTMLPYKSVNKWSIGEKDSYYEMNINLISTDAESISKYLNSALPDYKVLQYTKPKKNKLKSLKKGQKAPALKGYFLKDSTEFILNDYVENSIVLIDFWYQSCGPCIAAIPYIDSLQEEFRDKGLLCIGVNSRDHNKRPKDLIDFIRKRGGHEDMMVMTDLNTERKKWKNYANPTFYLIQDRKIVWIKKGFSPDDMNLFRTAIGKHVTIDKRIK